MQDYSVGPITIQLEKNNHFSPVEINFSFTVPFHHIVPDDVEEATDYHDSVSRTIKFLQGLHTAYVCETSYEETELFVTGRINNVCVEVPDGGNKIPLLGAILYHKTNALMKNFPIDEFKISFKLIDDGRESVSTQITYNDMTYLGSKIEAIIQHYEEEWTNELSDEIDELSEIVENPEDIDHPVDPWWRRCDGQVRDFVKLSIFEDDEGEGSQPSMSDIGEIRVLSVDIGDETVPRFNAVDMDDNDDDPETDDDGYFKI